MKTKILFYSILVIIASCKSMNKTEKGAVIGTGAGAAGGAVIGNQMGNTAAGAIIGAVVGGVAGGLIGNYMDKQAEEIKRDIEGAKIERIGEGIKITFDTGLLFNVNSSTVSDESKKNLEELSTILNKYDDTNILIEGHTDNTGTAKYNKTLSEERAASVATQLKSDNVNNSRITTVGYGEEQPVADNSTEVGRKENRRVEVAIYANKKLKKAAEEGTVDVPN
jgi:outer membrane protein OmpA-like peptidoglycan-associated protein